MSFLSSLLGKSISQAKQPTIQAGEGESAGLVKILTLPKAGQREGMAHLRALAAPPPTSVLCARRRPPAVAFAFAFTPLARRSLPSRPKVALFGVSRGSFRCRMKGSDISSDLELAKVDGNREPNRRVNGIFWILLLNLGVYVADHILKLQEVKFLYLYHKWPAWYQFVTATFCHANWNHLSSNLFFLYIFGKLVEEEEGNFALWISYILTGAGANLISWLLLPRSAVSVGASGAVFGLFAISVLVKMSWDWRKIIEVVILGQFVIDRVMEAAQASTSLPGTFVKGSLMNVNHVAHLSGALVGVALVLLVNRIPFESSGEDVKSLRGGKNKRT